MVINTDYLIVNAGITFGKVVTFIFYSQWSSRRYFYRG